MGLAQAVQMWPTPTTQEIEHPDMELTETGRRKPKRGKTSHSMNLADSVKMWPTPAAHEGRLGYQRRDTGKKGTQKSLSTEVIDDAGGREKVGGQLNPMWVEWLMNWPLNWTSLEPLPNENYELWKKASTTQVQCDGYGVRPLWWLKEPASTSQGSRHAQQSTREHQDSMRVMPRADSRTGAMEGSQQGEGMSELREGVCLSEGEAENVQQELWEQVGVEVPRVSSGVSNRTDRLKALGNGQCPAVAATAWRILTTQDDTRHEQTKI
jgi:hypothetical protein